jgi:hypothetical protein
MNNPTDSIWLVFDNSNGDEESKRYVWWFETLNRAKKWITHFRSSSVKHKTTISKPVKFIPFDKPLILAYSYCENDIDIIGVFESQESLFKTLSPKGIIEDIKYSNKESNMRLDWGLECTFIVNKEGNISRCGYNNTKIK